MHCNFVVGALRLCDWCILTRFGHSGRRTFDYNASNHKGRVRHLRRLDCDECVILQDVIVLTQEIFTSSSDNEFTTHRIDMCDT